MARHGPEFLTRLGALWQRVWTSLWFLPALMTLAALALAAYTLQLDVGLQRDPPINFLLRGGAAGARGVLTAISGSIVTVTGTVFAVTIVALQLASTQFTPRILRNFTTDRGNQLVLGTFIGTFAYSTIVLRAVIEPSETTSGFVPTLSVTVAVGLALLSIAVLIYFIDHLAKSIQAATLIDGTFHHARDIIENRYPQDDAAGEREEPDPPPGEGRAVTAERGGYLQGLDESALRRIAAEHDLLLRVECRMGAYVLHGATLATAHGAGAERADIEDDVRDAFVLGHERTPHHDAERGLLELADVAVKALSPGINDPTTAMMALDRIGDLLVILGSRRWPERVVRDEHGRARVFLERAPFDAIAGRALDQVRHFAAPQPTVIAYFMETATKVGRMLPRQRRNALVEQVHAAWEAARLRVEVPHDRARVEAVYRASVQALERP